MMKVMHADLIFSELDQFSLMISAVAHDVGHPGVNNPFLIETSHELALRYNDKSPLENMHCAKLFEMVTVQDANIFEQLPKDAYKDVRKICIEAILHTDMVAHFSMVKDLTMLYHNNSEVWEAVSDVDAPPDAAECELLRSAEHKKLSLNLILHAADVSNPCKVWDICNKWAVLVLEEFFAQGDQEKSLGIPVQMLNDRDKVNKPNSQIGFIEFIVAPLFVAYIKLFPTLYELGDNLVDNMEMWEQAVIAENKPSDEEKTKTHARIMKVATNVEEAKNRGDKQPKKQKKVDNLMKEK
jgi:cAMP-specific phosphodiesterase 4